jgi:hypothetical protein
MRRLGFRSALQFGLCILPISFAIAQDASNVPVAGRYYGNLHAALDVGAINSTPEIYVPYIALGGKVAYDTGPGSFGYQLDTDANYTDLSWISPTITSTSVGLATGEAAAHLTYITGDNNKIGIFVGTSTITLSSGLTSGSNSISITAGLVGIGLEDIVAVSDDTSIQVRAAVMEPGFGSLTFDTGSGSQTFSGSLNTGIVGYSIMGGVSHRFDQNLSGRADISYASFSGNVLPSSLSFYHGSLTGQYTFDESPISLGMTAGYGGGNFGGATISDFSLGAKATYSFGGPSSGVTGKLFHSGLFSLLN